MLLAHSRKHWVCTIRIVGIELDVEEFCRVVNKALMYNVNHMELVSTCVGEPISILGRFMTIILKRQRSEHEQAKSNKQPKCKGSEFQVHSCIHSPQN